MISKLAWKNLWFKPLNTILSIILLTSSIAIITVLILLQKQFEEQVSSNADNIDLVLGANGSPLQLVLSSVYQIDSPTGNISYDSAKVWMKHPFVESAIPLSFGDSYKGFRIVGTTIEYVKHFNGNIDKGVLFEHNLDVFVGSNVAKKLNLKLGNTFQGTHGSEQEGEIHDRFQYKVVGIAKPTGKVLDNLILSNIESVWQIHSEHHDDPELSSVIEEDHSYNKEITAVLLKFKNKMAVLTWPRMIAQNTKMQAASPAIEINRLFSLLGIGLNTLEYLAYGIMIISGISIFISLYNRLKERKYEFALLRLQGAYRFQIIWLVVQESFFLCLLGYFSGNIVGRLVLNFLSNSLENELKLAFNPFDVILEKEGLLFIITILLGILAALIPAVKAYRINISKTLTNG